MKLLLKAGIPIIIVTSVATGIYLSGTTTKEPPASYTLNISKSLPQTNASPIQSNPPLPPQTTTPVPTQLSGASNTTTPVATNPTPQENKDKIMSVITDFTESKGMSQNMIYAQTTCFDRVFATQSLYNNYSSLESYPLLQKFLAGQMYFDGAATCRTLYIKTAE